LPSTGSCMKQQGRPAAALTSVLLKELLQTVALQRQGVQHMGWSSRGGAGSCRRLPILPC
jgi:hypothetical protein